ncbi:hypothetical protein [Kitasatospora sp. NPDC050543]
MGRTEAPANPANPADPAHRRAVLPRWGSGAPAGGEIGSDSW